MSTKQTNILLVEDNPGDAQLVKIFLKDAAFKYDLLHAETFFEGIDILNRNDVEIVLLDLSLPDSSGFKTLSRYLETMQHVPVIVLTGTNNEIVGNQAVKAGAQDFLVKGQFDGKLLGRAIRYSLQRFKSKKNIEDEAKEMTINARRIVESQEMVRFGNWEMDLVNNSMNWTDEVYRIFGFQPNSFTPTLSDYINYVHVEDRVRLEDFFELASKDGKLHRTEHRIIVDGYSLKHLALHAKVSFDDINQRFVMLGGIQDITERKVNEQMIIEQNINRKTSKLKEEVLADMSFHIRTPMSTVVNLLYLLNNTKVSVQQKELVDGLRTSVDDLSMMINNLLNFSMLVSENMKLEEEEFYIKDFMYSLKKVVHIKSDMAKIKLEFNVSEDLPDKISSDPQKITQILYNLVDNAIKFTSMNGKITINVTAKLKEDKKHYLNIKVTDSGKGMGQEKVKSLLNAAKVMQALSENDDDSLKGSRQFGLAIITKLMAMMNGHLDITSKEGIGSTFEVNLPITMPVRAHGLDIALIPTEPLKILLVEDHFLNQIATKKILTTWSDLVTVDVAENGLVAVEKFRAYGYDLILMDLQMPVMNGVDAAVRIRESSFVPIVALTASSTRQEADRCYEVGMNDYLAKPFKPQDLYEKIMSVIAKNSELTA